MPSTAKSPQQMFGAITKSYYAQKIGVAPENITVVSVMPCLAKKYEASREEFAPHGIRSYFAKPFYTEQGLHAILILASLRPGSFGADAETRFASLMGPFERLIGAWRKG